MSDVLLCPSDSYTFFSEAHHTTSWLDHIITSSAMHSCITDAYIDYKYVSSDHLPLCCKTNIGTLAIPLVNNSDKTENVYGHKIKWDNVDDVLKRKYNLISCELLEKINVPKNVIHCNDPYCKNSEHIQEITDLYDNIIDVLIKSSCSLQTQAKQTPRHKKVPGWNDVCKQAHSEAREAFLMWRANGSKKQGVIYQIMCKSRAVFKSVLRQCRKEKDKHISDSLAKKHMSKDTRDFWKIVKKCTAHNIPKVADTIDGVSGKEKIIDVWKMYFENLLNANYNNNSTTDSNTNCEKNLNNVYVSPKEVKEAIKDLKAGKAAGYDGLNAEHFMFASDHIYVLLCLFFNVCILHGFLPDKFMDTVITPIVKDAKDDVTKLDNYRPIAVTCVCSKILEIVILKRLDEKLYTCDNQFGFKRKHSTDMAVFTFKQIINYYISLQSPVYICFLDASKAFDRINHEKLFQKLLNRKVDKIFCRLLMYWYCKQTYYIKWDGIMSDGFNVTNGVRQGGILSSALFNVYINGLSENLNASKVGCHFNDVCINHLMYADDGVLIAPSPNALQTMLDICETYGNTNDILYNSKKSVIMCIKPKECKSIYVPTFYLQGKPLSQVSCHQYLGVLINDSNTDNNDIERHTKATYINGNKIISYFKHCTANVKVQLFKTFCSNFYCSHLWTNYYKYTIDKANKAYKKVFSKLFSCTRGESITQKMILLTCNSFNVIRRKSIYNFRERILCSKNDIIATIRNSLFFIDFDYKNWLPVIY